MSEEQCPDCGGVDFYEGPHGGASVNVKCAHLSCGRKFCWSPLGDMLPIDNSDELYKGRIISLADLYQRARIAFLEHAAMNMQGDFAAERTEHALLKRRHEELQRRYDMIMQRKPQERGEDG
jgi:hypothetical protein